jgi:hypothetical protein
MVTLAETYGLSERVYKALMGHSKKTASEGYGRIPIKVLHRELLKIPSLDVS